MSLTGLFGGTFNPIHLGHLKVAEEVIRRLPLDRILFIPSYIPPHKSPGEVVPVRHRLKMVEIACRANPAFKVSEVEARRPGPSYSIETLRKLKQIHPEDWFFFIVGLDAFLEIDTWKDYTQLLQECSFIVVSRPGFGIELSEKVIEKIKPAHLVILESDSFLKPDDLPAGGLFLLPAETPDISSTDIRKRLRAGQPITGLVPPGVEAYIIKHRLYH
ncbi:MAG: nicotinate-nucleotide adenylyltransferase [Candidatus Saccharicenans sp.]|uniref:nicotinate-nucleotide adenylyltransferase n=1 Tax=Candidatus Saccharicenans sp. TaxID=2819258 RepID=UPI004049A7DE